jgi:hypothetical protein
MLTRYFRAVKSRQRPVAEIQQALFRDLSAEQTVALERFLGLVRQTGQCVVVTDLDEMLTAFSGGDLEHSTIAVLADYLAAGGVLVFNTRTPFDWFYYRLLRPLIIELGPRSRLLANLLLVLAGGREVYVFEDSAYRLAVRNAGKDMSEGFDTLVKLSMDKRFPSVPDLHPDRVIYIGDAPLEMPESSIINLHLGYPRTIDLIVTASAALKGSGRPEVSKSPPEVGDTVLWTFQRKHFPSDRRVRVRVGASGYVHAGVARANGSWNPLYNVPLTPSPDGGYEAVLPAGVDRFTFFWTEAPWMPGHPGHWERESTGGRVFEAVAAS